MARFTRVVKVKRGTLHSALEICDRTMVMAVISQTKIEIDVNAGLEVMNIVKQSRETYKGRLTPLQGAILLGNYNVCKQLVEEGASLQSSTSVPHPLCLAVKYEKTEIARLLIESGADIKMPFENKQPLGFALDNEQCSLEIVKEIIEAGFPVNDVINFGTRKTTLHAAVNMNRIDIVSYLLTREIDLNKVDKNGLTPLHCAVQKDYASIVKLLVRAGAIIDCECVDNITPMLYAISSSNYEMVKLLLTLGADIHFISGSKRCPMMPLHSAANLYKLKITQLLLEKGAEVNRVVPLTGEIALHAATRVETQITQQNKVALDCIVELLINEGSNIEAKQKFGLTPLQSALKIRNISVAKILILNGANINSMLKESDNCFETAFHLVAKTFDKDLIQLSLDYGADYMAKDSEGLYPCNKALIAAIVRDLETSSQSKNNQSEVELSVLKMFWRHGFPFDLTLDVKGLKPEGYCTVFAKVASMVQKQKMLLNGIKAQNAKLVQKALSQGADVRFFSKEQKNPLHFIASKGDEQILKEFLTRGAIVNSLNRNKDTPLHLAAKAGHVNCCRLLLEHGAVYNYKSKKSKKNPLDMAKQNNNTEVVALLTAVDKYFREIEKGNLKKLKPDMKIFVSVMNCSNRNGRTILGRALQLNLKEVASKLMKLRLQMVKSIPE